LEVWGAEGGSSNWHNEVTLSGGKGGYSCGTKSINGNSTLYISVGKSGISNVTSDAYVSGVFNGGAGCKGTLDGSNHQMDVFTGTGGGCTSIQTSKINDGQLKHYESVKNTAVLIVAGGGGGAVTHRYSEYNHRWCGTGGAGGGLAGVVGEIFNKGEIDGTHQRSLLPTAGTQDSAGVGYNATTNIGSGGFGYGMSISDGYNSAGGGGGWYGGGASYYGATAGGSGYIGGVSNGNTIAGNESMPSTSGGTETGHTGNGYCKITWHPSL
jgi:hypothetical protein